MTDQPLSIVDMQCCRVWPIVLGYTIGRCGLCGQKPTQIDRLEGR